LPILVILLNLAGNVMFVSSIKFPSVFANGQEGLVAVGGSLDVGTLVEAYRRGVFPWPQEGLPYLWFSPEERGVLVFSEMHVSKSNKKLFQKDFEITKNKNFEQVIDLCQKQPRPGQQGTWILPAMKKAYIELHHHGFAQSFEVWQESKLVGGLYGVMIDGVFSGESMFYTVDNASKRALLAAVDDLQNQGLKWMDTQMVTPVVESFGARLIARKEYLEWLKNAQEEWRKNGSLAKS
jgi:leucyl/phenylalanyl-tRNA---protein transferase